MPRYFFMATNGICSIQDDDGQEYPNLDAACRAARQVAEQLWADLPANMLGEAVTVEIVEAHGREQAAMRFQGLAASRQQA